MNKIFTLFVLLLAFSGIQAQKTGVPQSSKTAQPSTGIYQKFCQQLPSNANAETVRAAILGQKPNVQMLGCDLRLRHQNASPGGFHYTFDQTWNGFPIYLGEIKANLNRQMRFMNLLDNLRAFTGTPASFTRTDAQVAALLPALLEQGDADFELFPNARHYFLLEGSLVPVHRVNYTSNTQTWEVLLADDDLREVLRRDIAAYRKPLGTTTDTTGNAMVFMPDPLTSSGNTYGAPYSDNNDADSPELNLQRVAVTLKNINWNGSAFELIGPYVMLEDREGPLIPMSTSVDGNFNYTRSQAGFEDVMVYYHIDTFQRYVQSLGFSTLLNGQVKADPHGLNGQDNSHYISTDNRVAFGEGGVDDAEDADVVIHEYGHALSNAGSPFSNSGLERQGLDEGIGDYVATTYSRGISYTFWKNVFTWDGHNEFWTGRSASNNTLYPPSNANDIYLIGAIWNSTLMEVWVEIGKEASDKVFFESLYGHAPNTTLTDAALIHIDADSALFGGLHHDQFQNAFCQRGILTGTMQGQGCYVSRDEEMPIGFEWVVFPNPAMESVTLMLNGFRSKSEFTYSLTDVLGRELVTGMVEGMQTKLEVGQLPSGVYFLQLRSKGGWLQTKRLRVE
jgi:hypothetical protein